MSRDFKIKLGLNFIDVLTVVNEFIRRYLYLKLIYLHVYISIVCMTTKIEPENRVTGKE